MSPELEKVAASLLQARRTQTPADAAPLERLLSTPEEAYAVQEQVLRALDPQAGAVARYWKSGGAARPAVLTHAPLPAPQVWPSPADGSASHFNMRLVEAEVALRLGRDVTAGEAAGLTPEAAVSLVDAMAVSLEIVDSRWQQARTAGALLKLADLQSHGALAVGEWQPFAPRDWSRQACQVQIGDAAPQSFRGTHSLDDPTWLLPQWLRHVSRHGATVPRGTVVTTGTWCGMLPAQAGERVHAVFDGIGEASIQL